MCIYCFRDEINFDYRLDQIIRYKTLHHVGRQQWCKLCQKYLSTFILMDYLTHFDGRWNEIRVEHTFYIHFCVSWKINQYVSCVSTLQLSPMNARIICTMCVNCIRLHPPLHYLRVAALLSLVVWSFLHYLVVFFREFRMIVGVLLTNWTIHRTCSHAASLSRLRRHEFLFSFFLSSIPTVRDVSVV